MYVSDCQFRDGHIVSDDGRPYFVAEVNSSHNGNVEIARKMIDAAAAIGCDCVKFQFTSARSLYSATYYADHPIAKRFVDRFSLSPDVLAEMAEYARAKGLSFSSTPYSEEEVDFLVDTCKVPFLKIASMELNHLDFLSYIGAKKVPLVLSTGRSAVPCIHWRRQGRNRWFSCTVSPFIRRGWRRSTCATSLDCAKNFLRIPSAFRIIRRATPLPSPPSHSARHSLKNI